MEDSDSDSSGCKAPPRGGAIRLIHVIQSDVLTGGIIRFIEIFSRMPDVNILILSDVKTISNKTLLKHLRKLPKARVLAVKLPPNLPKTLREACFALLVIFTALSSRRCIDVAYSDENLRGVLAGFALRTLAKKPWICTFQGLWEFSGLQKVLSHLTMKISSHATAIVVPSQSVKEKLLRYARKLADKVHVIESGIDPSLFKPMSLKKELDCIYVGRISWEKGIDVLLRAWSIVLKEKPDAKLGIVGDGGSQNSKLLRHLKGVYYYGWVDYEHVPQLLNKAKIFLCPSKGETFCQSLLEALACGLLAITSRLDVFKRLWNDAVVYVDLKPELWAKAILELIHNGNGNSPKVRELACHFTWDKAANKMKIVLLKCLRGVASYDLDGCGRTS